MYTLTVQRDFVAQHFLTVPNAGRENEWHSHHFTVKITLKGRELDEHGYLVDIVEVEDALEGLIGRYRDETLNDLSEFDGLNPSIEHFSRILCRSMQNELTTDGLDEIGVRIWEDEQASASYSVSVKESS